eukprot:gene13085-3831_t
MKGSHGYYSLLLHMRGVEWGCCVDPSIRMKSRRYACVRSGSATQVLECSASGSPNIPEPAEDELHPVSKVGSDWPMHSGTPGMGLTIVESLDTMWLMGMKDEFDVAVNWIEKHLSWDRDITVSVFEATIRFLGGLISGYELSGRKILLQRAKELGDRMLPAFNTPSRIPHNYINLRTG